MSNEEKKKARQSRKEARRERRAAKPSKIKQSFMEMSGGVRNVREIYHEMNLQMNGEDIPEEPAEEASETAHVPKMRHAKGMFKIRTGLRTGDVFYFMMDHEMRTASGILGMVVDIAVFLLFIISLFSGKGSSILITLCIMIMTLLVVGPTNIWLQAISAARKANAEDRGATYTFSTAGFDILYDTGDYVRFKWDDVYSVREGRQDFFIYLDYNDGIIIPKKDIAAAGRKAEQFAELLTEKVGEKFVVKNKKNLKKTPKV